MNTGNTGNKKAPCGALFIFTCDYSPFFSLEEVLVFFTLIVSRSPLPS
jgi:hypothetical protein